MHNCRFRNCRFDGAELSDLRVWNATFTSCSFRAADLAESGLGGRATRYEAVDFTAATLAGASAPNAEFRACNFDGIQGPVRFSYRLEDCRFSGRLHAEFAHASEGRPVELTRVDFSNCRLADVSFFRVRFRDVKWPDDVVLLTRDQLDEAVHLLAADPSTDARVASVFVEFPRKWMLPDADRAPVIPSGLKANEARLLMDALTRIRDDGRVGHSGESGEPDA